MANTVKEYYTEATDAYLGSVGYKGNNARSGLYGSDLAKRFRQEFKDNGIKGVTVKSKSAGYTDSFTFTFKVTDEDAVSLEEYRFKMWKGKDAWTLIKELCGNWIATPDGYKYYDYVWDLPQEELELIADYNIEQRYNDTLRLYTYRDAPEYYSDAFKEKVRKAKQIINSYNYDNSNSMVDYFDTGFYYGFKVKDCRRGHTND